MVVVPFAHFSNNNGEAHIAIGIVIDVVQEYQESRDIQMSELRQWHGRER